MMTATHTWQDLFTQQRHAMLGQLTRAHKNSDVRSLSDEETLLVGGATGAARQTQRPTRGEGPALRSIVASPDSATQSVEEYQAVLASLRAEHPGVEISGYGPLLAPLSERFHGLDRGVVLAGRAGHTFAPSDDVSKLDQTATPLTAVLVYSPDVTPQALEDAVHALRQIPTLASVVALPAGAGDRIPLAGLTTSGTLDLMVISVLRLLLPKSTRVRTSWAALGWKVAQVALAYGADEIAGWTGAEMLAYTGRVRAAARVERQELNEGITEARVDSDLGWYAPLGDPL